MGCGTKKMPGDDLLSHPLGGSTIGAGGLNFRGRNGNGCFPSAVVTRQFLRLPIASCPDRCRCARAAAYARIRPAACAHRDPVCRPLQPAMLQPAPVSHEPRRARRVSEKYGQAARAISTGRLNMLPCVDRQPINQLFSLGPLGASRARGWFILRKASHLDAFSGYPVRTWLLSTCRWRDN